MSEDRTAEYASKKKLNWAIQALTFCTCDHPEYDHDETGACKYKGCDCKKFTRPGAPASKVPGVVGNPQSSLPPPLLEKEPQVYLCPKCNVAMKQTRKEGKEEFYKCPRCDYHKKVKRL